MSSLNFTIIHSPGKSLKVVECLNRAPLNTEEFVDEDEIQNDEISNIFRVCNVVEETYYLDEIKNVDITLLQSYIKKDQDYLSIVETIQSHMTPANLHNDHPAKAWAGE